MEWNLHDGALAICTSPPLTCIWLVHYLKAIKKEWRATHEMKKINIKHFNFSCSIHPSQHSFISILKVWIAPKQVNTLNFGGNLGQPNIRKSSNDKKGLSSIHWRRHYTDTERTCTLTWRGRGLELTFSLCGKSASLPPLAACLSIFC